MKKSYLMMAAAAALFAACSSDSLTTEKQSPQTQDAAEQAVNFSAYVGRGTTRAGQTGDLTTGVLRTSNSDVNLTNGFGVFAYYTNNELYNDAAKPDFMYNQKVYYDAAQWKYEPIKYWPNEFGDNAISDGQDKITFFAYAPYVPVDLSTGIAKTNSDPSKTGIMALTRNTASGDPFVKYFASMKPADRVDFCWGVAANNFTSSVDDVKAANTVPQGSPFLNVSKPKVGDRIAFDFKHALAALNVTIDADINELSHGTGTLDTRTKIWVRSVTFEGFTTKGMFNLNANYDEAKWYDLTGVNEVTNGTVTVFDGRRDGKEGQTGANASNESPYDLNPVIVQSEPYVKGSLPNLVLSTGTIVGVQTNPVNLFNDAVATEPILVIPTDENLKVTIVYDVETYDPNLPKFLSDGVTKGSSIENTISKEIKLNSTDAAFHLKEGTRYNVSLHLGMTDVKFDATVTEWEVENTNNTDLPYNTSVLANSAQTITVPASTTGGTFVISGLTSGSTISSVTPEASSIVSTATSSTTSITSTGQTTITYALTGANMSVNSKDGDITVVGATPTTNTVVTVKQLAHALGMTVSALTTGGTSITVSAGTGVTDTDFDYSDIGGANISVTKITAAGTVTELTHNAGTPGTGEYKIVDATNKGTITLGDAAALGDRYVITIKMGEAAPETVSVVTVAP